MSRRVLRLLLAGATIVTVLAGIAVVTLSQSADESAVPARPRATSTPSPSGIARQAPSTAPPGAAADLVTVELERLRAVPPVAPGPADRRIVGEFTEQPDLYAAEFVRRLLTQDYRTPRTDHLAWVQSEAVLTTEPLVVGLVPKDLRNHLAVYSVTDAAGQTPVIPTPHEWTALGVQQAYTTVRIQRVEEPLAWSTAVSSGRISDPGITGREVSASVTLHSRKAGRDVTSTSSVALALNIQGPPTRRSWGFVAAVTYSSLAVSAS